MKLTDHAFACNVLTNFESEACATNRNRSYTNVLKFAWKNSWSRFGYTVWVTDIEPTFEYINEYGLPSTGPGSQVWVQVPEYGYGLAQYRWLIRYLFLAGFSLLEPKCGGALRTWHYYLPLNIRAYVCEPLSKETLSLEAPSNSSTPANSSKKTHLQTTSENDVGGH